nr:cytidine deaminase [Metamycoplasma arthritidis]
MNINKLKERLQLAHAPYSGVQVAALAITSSGTEYYGVNCENPAFPSGLCAERSALFGSVAYGAKVGDFKEIHIISNKKHLLYPCSGCLQVITHFLREDGIVYIYNNDLTKKEIHTIKDMVPYQVKDKDIIE